MFNNLGNLADLMRNAGKIRESVEKATEALGQVVVEGTAGGGAVLAKVNGKMELLSIRIDPKLLADGDTELLEDLVTAAVKEATDRVPKLSTSGGTSDARFIRNFCSVLEFGLVGQTMHKVDECAPVADLVTLTAIYRWIIDKYFG